jgi:hypothetical protein
MPPPVPVSSVRPRLTHGVQPASYSQGASSQVMGMLAGGGSGLPIAPAALRSPSRGPPPVVPSTARAPPPVPVAARGPPPVPSTARASPPVPVAARDPPPVPSTARALPLVPAARAPPPSPDISAAVGQLYGQTNEPRRSELWPAGEATLPITAAEVHRKPVVTGARSKAPANYIDEADRELEVLMAAGWSTAFDTTHDKYYYHHQASGVVRKLLAAHPIPDLCFAEILTRCVCRHSGRCHSCRSCR